MTRKSYLSVNFTLILEKDVRLSGQRQNAANHRDGRRAGGETRGSSLLEELACEQESKEGHGQAEQPE